MQIEFDEEANQNYYKGDKFWLGCFQEMIKKHSEDIIDLIEVGDLIEYWQDDGFYQGYVKNFADKELIENLKNYFGEDDIKSVITKEMMESISYKVERKD